MCKLIRRKLWSAAVGVILGAAVPWAGAQETAGTRFDIVRFQVDGNSILPAEKVQSLVAPFVGRRKVYGDIQKALESLENEYRRLGYGTVNVYVPEQELTGGVVRIQVTEAVVGKLEIIGNEHHDRENILASLPQLKVGTSPNMRQISENVQLANENPSKKIELTFGVAEEEGKVDAKIEVKDEDPDRVYVTLDNTGGKTSGVHRLGVSYQNSNLFNADHTLTLAYITAVDPPGGVKVDIFSAGYRFPMYGIGDSIDIIYANSSTNTPASVLTPGSNALGIMGKGEVYAFRYNYIFPRQGEFSSKLIGGLDYKHFNATCATLGKPTPTAPGSSDLQPSCTPYVLRPVSLTYMGNWMQPGVITEVSLGLTYHAFPMGPNYNYPSWNSPSLDRLSYVTGRRTSDHFSAVRFGGSHTRVLPKDMMARIALSGQHAQTALPAGEQIGLAGSTAVRGFTERAVAADRGYFANLELYSPEYAGKFSMPGSLKFVAFYDFGRGHNVDVSGTNTVNTSIASAGIGFRYSLNKDITAKFDLAHIFDNHQARAGDPLTVPPKIRGHFSFAYGF